MSNMKSASLAEIEQMSHEGLLFHDTAAPSNEYLDKAFWDNAVLEPAPGLKSVHLRLDADVFAFFKGQGKGHLTRMQDVLKAYVRAHQRS